MGVTLMEMTLLDQSSLTARKKMTGDLGQCCSIEIMQSTYVILTFLVVILKK